MSRILISGYHGFGNYGDEAILLAIKNNLSKSLPDVQLTVLSPNPESTASEYGVCAINRYNPFRIFKELYHADLLISGGGSLLQDVTSTRSLLYYLTVITAAKLLGKKVMLYANGIGPIDKPFNKWITKKVISRVDVITVREENSYTELINMNISKSKIQVTADPVFTFYKAFEEKKSAVDQIFIQENIPLDRPLVGISVRRWTEDEDFISCMTEICDYMIEKYNVNILFIPMQMSMDLEMSRRIQRKMKNPSYIISKEYPIEELVHLIGRLHLMVSMRLHTLIFSGVQEIPMLGIVYDPKVTTFLEMVDQPIGMNVNKIDREAFKGQINYAFSNYDTLKNHLREKIEILYKKAKQNDIIALDLLGLKDENDA